MVRSLVNVSVTSEVTVMTMDVSTVVVPVHGSVSVVKTVVVVSCSEVDVDEDSELDEVTCLVQVTVTDSVLVGGQVTVTRVSEQLP